MTDPVLTDRELAALYAFAAGPTEAVAARRLGTSCRTLRRSLASAARRLAASSSTQAVAVAAAAGLLDLEMLRSRELLPWPPVCSVPKTTRSAGPRGSRSRRADLPPCTACGAQRLPGMGGRGWCSPCYYRWYRAGRPEDGPPPAPGEARDEFVFLREQGVGVDEAAGRVGVEVRSAAKWELARKRGVLL